ncbi:hypothetical protein BH10PSE17_BH10PSE17_18590 [soil metagenome]
MDSLITAAAQALAAGDPLGALNRVSLRDDAPALALRGIAMAQMGDLVRARVLLGKASRAFGQNALLSRARCAVAEAEIAFAARDLAEPEGTLESARETLEGSGDVVNAAHARLLQVRRLALLGRLDEAEPLLALLDAATQPPALAALHALVEAGIAMRRVQARQARAALLRAGEAAQRAGIHSLQAEVERAAQLLEAPAARLRSGGIDRPLQLDDVEALQASTALMVDAVRHAVRRGPTSITLASRPILFTLAQSLAEAWPGDRARDELIARAFRTRRPDESHRTRLRVEIGRLRALLEPVASIDATSRGFALQPRRDAEVLVLIPPVDEPHAAVLALLADGQSWSSSSIALALDASQRTVQRALDDLAEAGKAQSYGQGRARRWVTPPMPGFGLALMLSAPLPTA